MAPLPGLLGTGDQWAVSPCFLEAAGLAPEQLAMLTLQQVS